MPRLDAQFVSRATGAAMSGKPSAPEFKGVSSDTRSIKAGQLFVALVGEKYDAHDFVPKALEAGAAGVVVNQGFELNGFPGACLFQVPDTLTALGDLAAAWRKEHKIVVAGITGSNGKTTTKEMLASVMQQRYQVLKNQGNLNNLIGLPLTLLSMNDSHKVAVVEMGMNRSGEIGRLTRIARPDVGVVTNVGPAHIGLLGSLEAIAAAKSELFQNLAEKSLAVINVEDKWLAPWVYRAPCEVLTFGFSSDPDVLARDLSALGSKQAFTLRAPNHDHVRIRLAAPGKHNVANALAAASCAMAMGMGLKEIKAGLESFRPVEGRLVQKKSIWGFRVLDDSYNANPQSVAAGVKAMVELAGIRRKVLVLGDMAELGERSAKLHHETGKMAGEAGCDVVLAYGKYASQVVSGAIAAGVPDENAQAHEHLMDLVEAAFDLIEDNDVVLVKGSRATRMERVVAALTTGEIA